MTAPSDCPASPAADGRSPLLVVLTGVWLLALLSLGGVTYPLYLLHSRAGRAIYEHLLGTLSPLAQLFIKSASEKPLVKGRAPSGRAKTISARNSRTT